jgi:hypothetical protein
VRAIAVGLGVFKPAEDRKQRAENNRAKLRELFPSGVVK